MTLVFAFIFIHFYGAFAWNFIEFQEDFYHQESLGFQGSSGSGIMDYLTCSWICLKHENCSGFTTNQTQIPCSLGNQSLIESLVKTSPQSSSKIKVFTKKNDEGPSYPHFIVISSNSILEDFSVDPVKSPIITKYKATTNYNLRNDYAYMMLNNGTLVAYEGYYYNRLFTWNFDHQDFKEVASSNSPSVQWCCSASAYKNDKMIDIGGYYSPKRIKFYENGQWRLLNDLQIGLKYSCATFVPSMEDIVYILGGYRSELGTYDTQLQAIHLINNSQVVIGTIPGIANGISNHGCAGGSNDLNQDLIIIVGGYISGLGITADTKIYNIQTDVWTSFAPLEQPLKDVTVVYVQPYFYAFGGSDSSGSAQKSVYKIKPVAGQAWEHVGNLGRPSVKPTVVPYNH